MMVYTKESVVKAWTKSDPSLERFNILVTRKRLAPSTRETYVKNVKAFVDWFKTGTPQQTIEKLNTLSVEERKQAIDSFVGFLLEKGVATTSVVQTIRGGVKKWLLLNKVEMNWTEILGEILPGEEIVVEDRMPTKEELKQLLNVGSLRDRVMILIGTSSGLRVGALASLTLGDVSLNEELPRITVKRKPGRKVSRKMKGFATFMTPEAKAMLVQYVRHRTSLGEKITELSPILTSDRKEEIGNFMNPTYLSNHWRRLLKRTHLATKNGGPWHDIHLHTLRKYFETQCTNAGVKNTYREFWMGHVGRHLEESYFRGEIETHVEEYRKAIPYLNILAPEPQDYKALVDKVRFLEENGRRKETELQKLRVKINGNVDLIQTVEQLGKELNKLKQEVKAWNPEASA